jgi:hypothetical protein
MTHVRQLVEGLQMREFAGTPKGIDLLEGDAALQETVALFAELESEQALSGQEYLGNGNLGIVAGMGELAIKVATPDTINREHDFSSKWQVNDLVGQFTYMTAFGKQCEAHPDSGISVPEQYFALKTRGGNFLSVQERIRGAHTLEEWKEKQDDADEAIAQGTYFAIHKRITAIVPELDPLRPGLGDLLVAGAPFVRGSNILIPAETEKPHTEDLTVIDQPGPGHRGKLAARTARINLRDATRGKTRPYIRHYIAD